MADTYWDLFLGYTALWVVVCFLMFHLMREQRKVNSELKSLRGDPPAEVN